MGIAAELDYHIRPPNAFHRLMLPVGATRPGAWVFSKTLRHADDAVAWVTKGRRSAPELMTGLPVIDVVTTGRKSGSPRRTHLIAIPLGESLALLGTNFGQRRTPAWVLNLEADPHATVTYRNRSVRVVARRATAPEVTEVWARSAGVYGGYAKYRERIHGRSVRVFVLEPEQQ